MPIVNLFFDVRRAPNGISQEAHVGALLDLCERVDRLPSVSSSVGLPEHHGFADGYLPSPVVLGAAIAGRTRHMRLDLVLVLPLYEPVRLAEDLAVLDLASKGRLTVTCVAGYVESDFSMLGVELSVRGTLLEEHVQTLKAAWTGEEFEYQGRRIRVTPRPYQSPRPRIIIGGSTRAAARRAVRLADGFAPTTNPELLEMYRDELIAAGRDPGPKPEPPAPFQSLVAVSTEPDKTWKQVAEFCQYESNSYYDLQSKAFGDRLVKAFGDPPAYRHVDDPDELRTSGRYLVLTPEQCIEWARRTGSVSIQPLMCGLDPAIATRSIDLIEAEVLPALDSPVIDDAATHERTRKD